MSTLCPRMETRVTGVLVLLRSTTSSLVFVVLSCRWFSSHHVMKLSNTALFSASSPLLINPTTAESSENFWRWLCLVAEFRGVKGEEERREDSPLWGPGVAHHCIWHTVLQAHVLWSASEIIHNRGHKGGSTSIAISLSPSRAGLMVLKALEKSKNMTLKVLPGLSRWA